MEPRRIKKISSSRLTGWGWLVGMCGLAGLVLPARGQYDPDWARNFRVGVLTGFNIKASFKLTPSEFKVSGGKPGVYDDGYIHPDPANTGDDFTSNWGYNNDGQYNAGAQELTFHRATSFSATDVTLGKKDDSFPVGFDMEYGGYPWRWTRMRLGFNLGFGFLPLNFSQKVSMTGSVMSQADTYSTDLGSGAPPPFFPPGGYHGSAGGEGWNIHSQVKSSSDPGTGDAATAVGTETLDVTLLTFRLGPSLFFDLTPKFGLAVGAGPAAGFIAGDYKFDETSTVTADNRTSRSHGQFGVSDFVFGGYVNATLTYHATLNGDFYLGAQYMPLGSANFSQGGREAKLDLSGAIFLSAGINWPF